MIALVALGADPRDAKPTRCIVIDVALHGKHGIRRLFAFLDTGAQANFLSQKVAIEEGLQADSTFMGVIAADGHLIAVYGQ